MSELIFKTKLDGPVGLIVKKRVINMWIFKFLNHLILKKMLISVLG
jgi:hypothetical protein